MIEMTRRVRIEVLVDAPLAPKLAALADAAGITGHTLFRAASGKGQGGSWREELVSGAQAKVLFLAVANHERADRFVESVAPLLETHGLIMLRSEVDVVRAERF